MITVAVSFMSTIWSEQVTPEKKFFSSLFTIQMSLWMLDSDSVSEDQYLKLDDDQQVVIECFKFSLYFSLLLSLLTLSSDLMK